MTRKRMHRDEVLTDEALVRSLLGSQFPEWEQLPLALVDSYGTDHDLYRLGRELVVRLPRIAWAAEQAAKEGEWLPILAPRLPLAVPVQLARGQPTARYPFEWSVYEWLPGADASRAPIDLDAAARDLGSFVVALRGIETAGAPPRQPGNRGSPLIELDETVRRSLDHLGERVDGGALAKVWEEALRAKPWTAPEVWVHGDLLPGNLLVRKEHLCAVIDFGGLNVGDPACDLQPAWNVFAGSSRATYRERLGPDDDGWARGRGWVVFQAVTALAYYWDSNPGMVRQATHALNQLLAE